MVFINVSQRAGVLILLTGLLVVWALVDPNSLQSAVDTVVSALTGAYEGAVGSV